MSGSPYGGRRGASKRQYQNARGKWPHGMPTKECKRCRGTGAGPGALQRALSSKLTGGGQSAIDKCPECKGHGRVIDNTGQCEHFLNPQDCAICRRNIR